MIWALMAAGGVALQVVFAAFNLMWIGITAMLLLAWYARTKGPDYRDITLAALFSAGLNVLGLLHVI